MIGKVGFGMMMLGVLVVVSLLAYFGLGDREMLAAQVGLLAAIGVGAFFFIYHRVKGKGF